MIAFVDVIYHYLSRYRHQDSPSMLISYALFTHAYGRKLKDNFPKIRSKRREMWSSMTNENKQSKKAISTSLVAGLSDDQEEADPFDDNQLEHAKFLQISNEMYHSHVITSPTYPYSDIDYFNGGGKEVPGLISLDEPTFTEVKPDGLRDAMRMLVNASQKHPLIWDMWIIYRCLNDWNAELTKEAHKNEAIVNAQVLRSKNADSKKRHKEIAKMAGSFGKVMKMDNLTNVTMEYSRQYDKLVESILTVLSKPSVDSLKLSAMVQRVLLMKQFATQGACLLMFTASYDANVITMKKRLARCEKNKGDGDDDVRSEKLQALDALLSYVLICECSQNEDQIRRDLAKNKDKERKKHCDNLTDSTQPTEQHRKVQKTLPLCVEQSDRAERLLTIIAELEDDNRIINEWAVTKKKKIEELKQLAKPNAQLPNHGMLDILKKQVEIGLGSPHGPRRTSLIQPLQLSSPRTVPPGGASPATPTLKTSPAGFLSNDTMKSPRRPSGLAHTLLPNQTNRARTNSIMSFGQALPGLMSPANFGPRDMQPQGWDFGDETNRSQQSPREVAPSPRGNRARLRRKSIGLTPNLISLMTGVHSTIEKDKEQIREYIQTESDNITTSEQELLSMIESRDYRRNKKLQELTMELANEYGLTQPTLANQEMLFQRLIDSSHQKPSPRFYSVWKQKAKGSRESQRVYYSFNVQLAVYVVSFLIFVFLTTGVLLTNVFFFDRNALRINIIHSLSEFAASVSQLNVNVRDLVSLTDSSFASPFNYTSIVSLTELIRTEREMVSKQMKLITNEQLPSSDPTIWRDRSIEMIVARPDDGTMSAQMSNSRWKTLINTIANSSTRNADFHSTPQTDITDTSFSNTPQASLDNITLILSSIPLSLYDSINAFTALSGELVDNILFSHNATSTEQVDPLFASSVTTILINGPTSLVEMIKHNMATIVEDQKDDVTVIILVFLIIFLFLGVVMVVSWIVTNVNSFKSLKTENRTNFDHLLNIFSYEEATIAITRRQALAANKNVPNPTDGCIKNPSSVEHIDFNLNPGPKPQQKLDVSPSPHSKTEPTLDIMDDSDPDTSEFSSTERSSSEDVEEVESEGSRTLNREASKALLNLRANKKEKKSPDTKLIRIPSSNSLFSFSSISSASSFVSDMSAQELDLRSEASAMPGKKINHSKSNATLNELPDDAAHTRPDMEDLARVSGTLPPVLKRSYFIMSITTAVIVILLIVFVVIWLCITYSSYSMDSPLSLIHSPASTDATNHYQVSLTSLIYITGQRWVGILTVKLLAQQFVFDRKPHILNKDDYFAPSASSVCGQGLCTSPIWLDTISSVAGSLNMLEHFVGNRSQLEILLGRGLTFLNSVNYVTRFGNQLLFSTDMDDDSGIPITQDSNIDKYQVRSIRSLYPSLSKLSRPHPSKPNQTITIESGMQELISHLRVLETSLDSSARDDGLTMAAFQYLYSDEYNELLELIEEEFNLLIDFVQQTTSRKQFAVITILLLSLLGVVVIGFACLFPAMTDFVRSSVNDEYVCKFAKSLGNAKLIQDERKQRRLVKERKKVRYLEKRLAQIERSKTRIPLLPDQETWSKFSKPRLETLIGSVCEEEKEDDVWDEKDADEEEELYHSNHQVILEDGLNSDSSKESGRRKANASTSSRDSS
ncbi:hypothetical protein BLNAU_10378 [Blattamonas nauphoetae]|uniref:Uncharacterized protein n=1 Tax=Blattamonas nauphoetae TaxID=2049346 RepID=A0ABQ9XTB4_9EUKA|nr:hypothetical protein BLNAU_10378 [Blattamonas nauphoetae]